MREEKTHWTIDKKINISVLAVALIQFTGFVYWISNINSSTINLLTRVDKLENWQIENYKDTAIFLQRINSSENKLSSVIDSINDLKNQNGRIENKLDRYLEKRR